MTRLLRKLRSNDVLKLPYNNICCCILYHTNELQQCLYLVAYVIGNLRYITVLEVFTISVSRSHRLYLKWISCKCLNSASQISLASLNDRRKKAICFFYQCVTYLECMKYWSVFFPFLFYAIQLLTKNTESKFYCLRGKSLTKIFIQRQ